MDATPVYLTVIQSQTNRLMRVSVTLLLGGTVNDLCGTLIPQIKGILGYSYLILSALFS